MSTKPQKRVTKTDAIEFAAQLGRATAQEVTIEAPSPDEVTLQDWAYDGFLDAGGFDAIAGSTEDPDHEDAIKESFFAAFKTTLRERISHSRTGSPPDAR